MRDLPPDFFDPCPTMRLRKACADLRRELPTAIPVRVRRRDLLPDTLGRCSLVTRPRRFEIEIDHRLNVNDTLHTLAHEYAHAMTWTEGVAWVRDHGPTWAVAYSRTYELLIEERTWTD